MRLEKIKLAGFKSFVDPTVVPMPSNLVGIVGPNGCGKSNVIDAVRWVMGESSAKMLRGESMADVIFNGSSSRKPVGAATIELIFDNSDNGAGGEYASYNQISVKRTVSRDGQSSYFLNSVRCRRKDITDLFLGTGLGPRSYSIIEQGMISRLIEARPEELRVFLEEAAGISKYKERRRETENRISRTRENLERLNDLREEVAKQLQHLQRQAATAEKYKKLKQDERRLKAELIALRWQALEQERVEGERHLAEMDNAVEGLIAVQRRLESEIEQARDQHSESSDQFNEVQGRFYALGAEIARLEESIQHARETQQLQTQDLAMVEQDWQEAETLRSQDEKRLAELNQSLDQEKPALEQAKSEEQTTTEQLSSAEADMRAWQSEWDSFNQQATEPAQVAQVERTRINHWEQHSENLHRRTQRLAEEEAGLIVDDLAAEIQALEGTEATQQATLVTTQEQLRGIAGRIEQVRQESRSQRQELDTIQDKLQAAKGRLASLEALQQAALDEDEKTTEWLSSHQLDHAQRLAQGIEVDAPWERAVEMVLGFHLQAVCVPDLESVARGLQGSEEHPLTLFETTSTSLGSRISSGETLAAKVKAMAELAPLFSGVFFAEDLDAALAKRKQLADTESLITPHGIWLGRNWLRMAGERNPAAGVLAREQELKRLRRSIKDTTARVEILTGQREASRAALAEAEAERENVQQQLNDIHRGLSDTRSALSGKRARAEQIQQRREGNARDRDEIQQQLRSDDEAIAQARTKLHAALGEMETLSGRREELIKRRDRHRQALEQARESAAGQRAVSHQLALKVGSMSSSRESLVETLSRIKTQVSQLAQRREELRNSLSVAEAPLVESRQRLEAQLAQRVEVEKELANVRSTMEKIDANLRQRDQERHQTEQKIQAKRGILDQARLKHQAILVRAQTLAEQLEETDYTFEQLLEHFAEQASVAEWEQQMERMAARIQRLGPINLAAIDEFEEQSERMRYLESQHADVNAALETLENAIRKIDRETRTRFKETFDKVNNGLQDMFPRLFGGGHAYLELTGEDLLDTGVAVMARPPGKRNSNIHLLSGGEKALTAVALIFAIFQLNPAPFCMLDEVDAPLDDANVERFCTLVKSMAEQVQFILITHNKGTMEIANQLTGVTMHEPGVSRLVSVDVEAAAQLAAM